MEVAPNRNTSSAAIAGRLYRGSRGGADLAGGEGRAQELARGPRRCGWIRFDPASKPAGFAERAEARGQAWLAANAAGRPRDYWSEFKPQLAEAFRNLCAYSAMYEPVGTVDHFVSCDEDRARSYDWANYRYAAAWINASKQALRSHEIVDPFAVEHGWFELILPSLQLVVTDTVPAAWRERAQRMLEHDEPGEFRPFIDEIRGGPRASADPVAVTIITILSWQPSTSWATAWRARSAWPCSSPAARRSAAPRSRQPCSSSAT